MVQAELVLWESEPLLNRIITNKDGKKELSNPLHWWRYNSSRFPRLAALARKLLAIQATSAPSERLFSAAGLTIAKDRSRLTQDNAAMLIFLHDNLPVVRAWRAAHGLPDI
jgi:hypothetical protein